MASVSASSRVTASFPAARIGAAIILALAVLASPGCSGGGVTGTYVAEEKTPDGQTMKLTLELKSGGVAVMTISGPDGEAMPSVTGTYTVEGDKIITVLDNDRDELTLKDGALTADFFGEQMVLKKQ